MKSLLLFDTAEGTNNIGDEIIMDYCIKQLLNLFPISFINRVPTHLEIGRTTFQLNKTADYSFVCGTNILKTSILLHPLWKLSLWDILHLKNLCLMGVGWGNYNSFNSDPYTKWAYRKIFSSNYIHSVRDNYSKKKLNSIGIDNVINTSCPTMWNLTPEFCAQIPQKKAKYVITSLTCYKKDIIKDKSMFHILNDLYEKIYFWPQQLLDIEYLKTLELDFPITILPPVLSVYDQLLSKGNIDYVGSRLHGGIRALNHCCRTLIVGVDNRAVEIHNDTNLPVMERSQIESKLESWVNTNRETNIVLPQDNIDKWKSQFC